MVDRLPGQLVTPPRGGDGHENVYARATRALIDLLDGGPGNQSPHTVTNDVKTPEAVSNAELDDQLAQVLRDSVEADVSRVKVRPGLETAPVEPGNERLKVAWSTLDAVNE